MSTFYPVFGALLVLSLSLWLYKANVIRNRPPLPPGPPRKFIVGNLFDISRQKILPVLAKWKERYGDIVYIEALGSPIVILNTFESANALLGNRGTNYSRRPIFTFAGELMGANRAMILMDYGKTWRERRKLTHIAISSEAIKRYHGVQEKMASLLLVGLLEDPQNFAALFRLAMGRMISAIVYGLDVKSADEYIVNAEAVNTMFSDAVTLGAHLVDFLPFLKYLPKWLPFVTFHQEAAAGRRLMDRFMNQPLDRVKEEIAQGHASPSFVSHILTDPETKGNVDSADFQQLLAWTAGDMYGAGIPTTSVALRKFVLTMTIFPEKQAIAQAELDRVVGPSRLPNMEDRVSLPYIDALIKEILRWNVLNPVSFPRRTDKDDIYKGHYIPAGTIVLPNIWSMAFDSCDRATDFIPERFLVPEGPQDPYSYTFGFGRRTCPGQHLASSSIFIMIASVLSVFNISKQRDELGKEIPVHPSFVWTGLSSHPKPFKCSFSPRSAAAINLLKPGPST